MIIRKYKPSDCASMAKLFYDTVHTINAKDYTAEQLNAWATGSVDLEVWNITDTSYDAIPKFWQEHKQSEDGKIVCGMYGVCMDLDGKNFDYLIADNYLPWNEVPDGFETRVIPAGTWAVFPCRGALPKSLQDVNTKIWSEWLPNCKDGNLSTLLN